MKRTLLCSALMLLTTAVYAEDTAPVTQPTTPPAASTDADSPAPAAIPATATQAPAPATETINCTLKIPAKQTTIDQAIIIEWTKNAALQTFTLDGRKDAPVNLDQQMTALKNCFTNEGWQGFSDALQKSGNLESIKSQELSVSSQLDGEASVVESKDNQWKVSIPLQVVYQNSKEKITQKLSTNIVIGRKPTGELGILQMVALPNQPAPAAEVAPAATPVNPTEVPVQ